MTQKAQYFETVIIGTGFSGLLAAIKLKKQNFNDFILLEREAEMGGTWQANSYPGAEVDIPTSLYSVSFIPYTFRKTYASQSELLDYTNHIINTFDLRKKTKTGQSVTELRFDEDECLWQVETATGEHYTCRFVVDTSGVFANPKTPYIQGAETFKGAKFHTARWNHDLSLKDKRVGIIGSGCSAAQVVPAIAGDVDKLTVFMRTPEWILPRSERVYSSIERFLLNLPGIRRLNRFRVFAVHEIRFIGFRRFPFTAKLSQFMKFFYVLSVKKSLKKYIKSKTLREYMLPTYELGSRRVIPTNRYLPALARDNVDVDISGIDTITPTGIRTKDGKNIPLDVLVYATGFYAYSNMKKALSFQVYGRNGRNLNKEWESEITSYKSITVSGFPNYFKVNGPNAGTGHSSQLSYMEAMTSYIVKAITAAKQDVSIKAIDVRPDIQSAYVAKTKKALKSTVWQTGGSKSFYRKNMTGEVAGLSPESVVQFIFSRKWFRLRDYQILK